MTGCYILVLTLCVDDWDDYGIVGGSSQPAGVRPEHAIEGDELEFTVTGTSTSAAELSPKLIISNCESYSVLRAIC